MATIQEHELEIVGLRHLHNLTPGMLRIEVTDHFPQEYSTLLELCCLEM